MINVLAVDDSSFMRNVFKHILEGQPDIRIIATAADGGDAVRKVKQFSPDVILLDIQMPVMDGLTALAHIMSELPTPVVIISGIGNEDRMLAIKALQYGAVDFIAKPSGVISYDVTDIGEEIVNRIRIAAAATVHKIPLRLPDQSYLQQLQKRKTGRKEAVVIGASTGGPRAISELLSALPSRITAPIIVVQHMYPEFIQSFAGWLQLQCNLKVGIAQPGEELHDSKVLIAPGGRRMSIVREGNSARVVLQEKDGAKDMTTSVDQVMISAANSFGKGVIGVLLSGVGKDGALGMKAIRDAGGSTIAQDEATCLIFGMPKAAIDLGCVDEVVPLPKIAETIMRMF